MILECVLLVCFVCRVRVCIVHLSCLFYCDKLNLHVEVLTAILKHWSGVRDDEFRKEPMEAAHLQLPQRVRQLPADAEFGRAGARHC